VGNAVPPLLASAIGAMLKAYHKSLISTAADGALIKSAAIQGDKDVQEICRLVSLNLSGSFTPSLYNSGCKKWGAK